MIGDPGSFAVGAILLTPGIAATVLALLPEDRTAARLNVLATAATLASAVVLFAERPAPGRFLIVDDLNVMFIVLNTFVGFTTSVFSASYIAHELETGRLTPTYLRFYHAMYQVLMFGMNLALLANNVGLMWVAVELATLTTVLMVGIYRTPAALEAAWKYFLLGSVGIALALFGTILVYLAARSVVGEGLDAMAWNVLVEKAPGFDPALLNLAFVFLLLGYGTKVGLVPLHAWLPDAHAEGPTPISAVLSGLLLNVALFAVLRFKSIMSANPAALAAGLLHMTLHSLTKSAIFYCVGHIAQVKGTQLMADIRGLTVSHPTLGWGLLLGVVAIAGLPPMGLFMTEFLIVTSTFARAPVLAVILGLSLLVALGALVLRLNGLVFGDPYGSSQRSKASFLPVFAHLALVLAAGIWLPPAIVAWFRHVATLLS